MRESGILSNGVRRLALACLPGAWLALCAPIAQGQALPAPEAATASDSLSND